MVEFKIGFAHRYEVSSEKEPEGVYNITADNETDVRHWVINHLDLGQNWTIKKIA